MENFVKTHQYVVIQFEVANGGDGCDTEYFWRRAVDRATFAEKVVHSLMTDLGCKAEIYAR